LAVFFLVLFLPLGMNICYVKFNMTSLTKYWVFGKMGVILSEDKEKVLLFHGR
jgi:hypothetical protein